MKFSGSKLQAFRTGAHLSRTALAERTDGAVSKSTIKRIETDAAANITLATIESLAGALDIPTTALFEFEEEEEQVA